MIAKAGLIYIVATPIGHLRDISTRAIEILGSVDLIAVEDTRHSQKLLKHLGIVKRMVALHEHNEREKAIALLEQINGGLRLALISDAGTPLICDPGYHLVRLAHDMGIQVVPIPGPCAFIAALSASGLPTDRFVFEGFLSAKPSARSEKLKSLSHEERTLIFYEAPHRILETLSEIVKQFGETRELVIARELTKSYETIVMGQAAELLAKMQNGIIPQRGEMVIIVGGKPKIDNKYVTKEAISILNILLEEKLSVNQAAHLTAKMTGISKRLLYDYVIKNKDRI